MSIIDYDKDGTIQLIDDFNTLPSTIKVKVITQLMRASDVPAFGLAKQFLMKKTDNNYDLAWANALNMIDFAESEKTVNGIKDNNTLYSNFTYPFTYEGETVNKTGSLLVIKDSETVPYTQSEYFFIAGTIYARELLVNSGGITSEEFQLLIDRYSTKLDTETTESQTVNGEVIFNSNIQAPNMVSHISSGATQKPTLVHNGNGNITVNACCINLYDNNDFNGLLKNYDLEAITVDLTDKATNYVVADYNNGNPILRVTLDRNEINQSNILPIFTIARTGAYIHTLDWDEMGKGAIEKNIDKAISVRRFEREYGLNLSVLDTRFVKVEIGAVWYGLTRKLLPTTSSDIDNLFFYYHDAGEWILSIDTQFNNTQYDNGTNLVELKANRYAVVWIWRGIEDQKHLYAVMGNGDYTINQALASNIPNIPEYISSHAMLIGRIIIQKGASTPYSVESYFDITFTPSGASVHNDLTGRDAENTHPMSAITNLVSTLASKLEGFEYTATVLTSGWTGNSATITVNGLSLNDVVFVSPNPVSFSVYGENRIRATSQGTNQLTLECDTIPSEDIILNIFVIKR